MKDLLHAFTASLTILSLLTSSLAFAKNPSGVPARAVFDKIVQRARAEGLNGYLARAAGLGTPAHRQQVALLADKAEMDLNLKLAPNSSYNQAVGHVAGTLFVIWVLSIVEATRQTLHVKKLQRETVGPADLLQAFEEATTASLANMKIWSGIAGGAVASTGVYTTERILRQPMAALARVMENKVTRLAFHSALKTAAISMVTFIGWSFGTQLIEDATVRVPDEDGSGVLPHVAQSLDIAKVLNGNGSELENHAFRLILKNATMILWGDPKLRDAWIYDTWRLSLGTGEFLTFYAAMTSVTIGVSALGTAFFGPLGALGGFGVGLAGGTAGGLVAMYVVPKSWQHELTLGIQDFRFGKARGQAQTLLMDLHALGDRYRWQQDENMDAQLQKQAARDLELLVYRRDLALTAAYEQIYTVYKQKMTYEKELDVARRNNPAYVPELEAQSAGLPEQWEKSLWANEQAVMAIYAEHKQWLHRFLDRSDTRLPQALRDRVEQHVSDLETAEAFSEKVFAAISPDKMAANAPQVEAWDVDSAEKIINGAYVFAFSEKAAVGFVNNQEDNP